MNTQNQTPRPLHTPTPWQQGGHCAVHSDTQAYIADCAVSDEPSMSWAECRANAAFIVRACNAYEADQRAIARLRKAVQYNNDLLSVISEIIQRLGDRRGTEYSIASRMGANRVALAETAPKPEDAAE